MSIEIRKAGTGDYEAVCALIREFAAFIRTPEKVTITPEQLERDRAYFECFVAVDGSHIIGFATCFYAYYSWTGKAICLDDLYVSEKYRGTGVGTGLFDKVIETGKRENCKKARWQVSRWNHQAIEFYKKRGAILDEVELNCDLILDNP